MSHPSDGVSLAVFDRAVVALEPGSAPRILPREALDTFVTPADGESELTKVLADLDLRYVGWLPGFTAQHGDEVRRVEAMHARRPYFTLPRLTPPTLPASTVRRADVIRKLTPNCVFMAEDADGLSVLLAAGAEVTVLETQPARRRWLESEAEKAGVANKLHLTTEVDTGQSFDLSIIYAGSPEVSHQQLSLALVHTRPGGQMVVGFKLPWEDVFVDLARESGLEVRAYHREIDQWLVPGPTVIDGGQDLAVFDRPERTTLPPAITTAAERVRRTPHGHLDIDSLDPARLDPRALERFADLVAAASPVPEESRAIRQLKDHGVLCWYDQKGVGFTAELRRAEAHLLVMLVPFDAALEYAVLFAATALFGDCNTRVRPLRTRRLDKESFLG